MSAAPDSQAPSKNPESKFKQIGSRPIRHDGLEKVTGRARFGAEIALPGMIHGVAAPVRIHSLPMSPPRVLDAIESNAS